MAHQIKEKIKHFLHHDKTTNSETTPDASPGYADLEGTSPMLTTDHVPEAFYPGSQPVVPLEQHPTDPYTGQLGTSVPPGSADRCVDATAPPTVPNDKAAMLGAPPSGDRLKADPAEEAGPQGDVQETDSRGTEAEAEPKGYPGSVSEVEPSPVPATEGKSPEEPTEEEHEGESPVTDQKTSDMTSEGGPAHQLEDSTPEYESEPATEEESSDLPRTDVDSKESPGTPGNDLEETPSSQTREETAVE